ncbi:hypothetical protein GCM10010405_25560 [Streptomyces macrosporus]|uniref:Uncharacterized protein n=1 Tax=Streptomyces macrosporus TaxID=44032 RepID=A0ABP5WZN6_9ACTN
MERVAQSIDPPQPAAVPGDVPRPSTGYPRFRLPRPTVPSTGAHVPVGGTGPARAVVSTGHRAAVR